MSDGRAYVAPIGGGDQTPYRVVWAAASGSYSSYRIDCLFERREDAEAYCAASGDRDMEPQQYTLYEAGRVPRWWQTCRGWARVGATADRDREPVVYESHRVSEATAGPDDRRPATLRETPNLYGSGNLSLEATGRDRNAVLKALSDRYAQGRAERDGL